MPSASWPIEDVRGPRWRPNRIQNDVDAFNGRTAPTGLCAVRPGTFFPHGDFAFGLPRERQLRERNMHGLIYLIGLIVVILFILSLLGLR
jgi:hypothetical protein